MGLARDARQSARQSFKNDRLGGLVARSATARAMILHPTVRAIVRGVRSDDLAGDMVQEHDIIETGTDGAVGVTFTDNSLISADRKSVV